MGNTANLIIKDTIHNFYVHQQKPTYMYFADGMALSRALI